MGGYSAHLNRPNPCTHQSVRGPRRKTIMAVGLVNFPIPYPTSQLPLQPHTLYEGYLAFFWRQSQPSDDHLAVLVFALPVKFLSSQRASGTFVNYLMRRAKSKISNTCKRAVAWIGKLQESQWQFH